MVGAVLSFAVEQLGSFITQKLLTPGEVRTNAEWLTAELKYMKTFLKDAETKKQAGNELVSSWIADIKDISNEVVNVLEEFEFKMGVVNTTYLDRLLFYACICTKETNVFGIGAQMKLLKGRVEEISKRRATYGIRDIYSDGEESSLKNLRRSTSYADGDQIFVGLEDVKHNLIHDLLKDNPHSSMVSIYGPGGSGKTSLARSLYDSKEVLSSFPCRAWTYVSQEYTIREVLRRVIKSVKVCSNGEIIELDRMNEEDLERFLLQLLENRKYLLVIDDVWDINIWGSLKRAFPDNHNHSRVIVTTRNKDVATQMGERISAHQIRLLNSKESWKLFTEKLNQGESEGANGCSQAMLEVGREMVTKCDGLPLAIVVLGGLLAHKKSLHEWLTVKERVWSHLISGSVEISNLLILSYDDLPSELKLCFLYVGMYPEDYEFAATHLMRYWMAEEFIKQGEKGEDMEDIAQAYLNELINRNLIEVAGMNWGDDMYCRIHDLVRNLAVTKAIEVDFFHIYNPATTHPPLHHRVRRQIVHHTETQRNIVTEHAITTSLRSLIVFIPYVEQVESAKLVATFRRYSRLSILDVDRCETPQELMKVIGSLKQLKLMSVETTHTTTIYLPPSIGNLTRLQTLVVNGGGSCHIPEKISKLKSLRYMYCQGGVEGNTAEIGHLSNLRTLIFIRYEHWIVIRTNDLVHLRKLSINDIKKQNGKDYSLESISKLKSLHNLSLECTDKETGFPSMDFMHSLHKLHLLSLQGKFRVLPSIEKWPESITTLWLEHSELEEDPIPTLARLPNMIRLDLVATHKPGIISFPPQSFPRLEQLGLCKFSGLKSLETEEGALPIIKRLYVVKCEDLTDSNMPERLKCILIRGPGEKGLFDQVYTLYWL